MYYHVSEVLLWHDKRMPRGGGGQSASLKRGRGPFSLKKDHHHLPNSFQSCLFFLSSEGSLFVLLRCGMARFDHTHLVSPIRFFSRTCAIPAIFSPMPTLSIVYPTLSKYPPSQAQQPFLRTTRKSNNAR